MTNDTLAPTAAPARRSNALPELRSLEAFVTVCEAGSMSHAAQRLGVSQSAVSQMIRGSAIRIYEQLCVAMVLANETNDPVTGEPVSPELKPDEMMALAEQALYMAPFVYAKLGMIKSPVPE